MEKKYNPYDDHTLHITQPNDVPMNPSDRQGFNDVIKHYDTVNGFQYPKQLDQTPRPLRQLIKWFIIFNVSAFVGFMIYDLFKLL
ncbi:hypothetical protein [Paenibacillus sp. PL2-23]|uniref:hypothetical protein n=1 Tax=Paenibacillus sp. PL2-23 TaxID=2100729 RepID=UPI0030FB0FD6